MIWLTLEQSREEPGKFQMKKNEQFILIMWTYHYVDIPLIWLHTI